MTDTAKEQPSISNIWGRECPKCEKCGCTLEYARNPAELIGGLRVYLCHTCGRLYDLWSYSLAEWTEYAAAYATHSAYVQAGDVASAGSTAAEVLAIKIRLQTILLAWLAEKPHAEGLKDEPAALPAPDRTGECWYECSTHWVWAVVGPRIAEGHPIHRIWRERPWSDDTIYHVSEEWFARDDHRRVPPMPVCPADKKLTGINLCPKKGDKVVSAWAKPSERDDYAYIVVGSGDPGSTLERHPLYGFARWGWEYVEKPQEHPAPKYKKGDWFVDKDCASIGDVVVGESPRWQDDEWVYKSIRSEAAYFERLWWLPIPPRPEVPANSQWELTGECREFVPGKDKAWLRWDYVVCTHEPGMALGTLAPWGARVWIARRKAVTAPPLTNREHFARIDARLDQLEAQPKGPTP